MIDHATAIRTASKALLPYTHDTHWGTAAMNPISPMQTAFIVWEALHPLLAEEVEA